MEEKISEPQKERKWHTDFLCKVKTHNFTIRKFFEFFFALAMPNSKIMKCLLQRNCIKDVLFFPSSALWLTEEKE